MKIKQICIQCKSELIMEKKDFKKVSEKLIGDRKKLAKKYYNMSMETEMVGLFKKEKKYIYDGMTRKLFKSLVRVPVAKFICPVCNTEQLVCTPYDP